MTISQCLLTSQPPCSWLSTLFIFHYIFLRLAKQSQFIPLQNVVYFITLTVLVRKIFTFNTNDVLLFKCPIPGPKGKYFLPYALIVCSYQHKFISCCHFKYFQLKIRSQNIDFRYKVLPPRQSCDTLCRAQYMTNIRWFPKSLLPLC